ncbi:MAG: ADP-ribose diphosphatase [Paraglaciecola sp.]|uniref:ADP-ribose diphosphatase n=1 Tax=Pseudomonadati TaxID=3379134 RepID=UPI00273D40E1|nr:ADP-ribose diphosphatase [Paraglaciecola sp.]MDP5031966.1 ADP-ribose diphosphatase [Paraglaciecola sp.]MDP5040596.1 ADP-ribose diphosphatase [Paraglaciecola sp.]MDP5129794.1 ADP-ribose diphosphatase [Paraglaciecola sp.]
MSKIQQFSTKDVQLIESKPLYSGFFKMVKYAFKYRLFQGGWSKVVEREIFERGHAVAVLLYDPDLAEFVMIEQIRIGAMATSKTPWLIEIVAGIIDEGETPENVCKREAFEEAGVEISHLRKALSYLASPGGTTERLDVFIAKVDASKAHGVHGLEYESEDILVHRVAEQQAIDWIEQGVVENAATLIALQWFCLNKVKLLEEWNKF